MRRVRKWFVGVGLLSLTVMACGLSSNATISIDPTAPVPSDIEQLAFDGVTTNQQWDVHTQFFATSEMVLVPAGCFMMGSAAGRPAEQPEHEVCFEAPFWLDTYEVTNQQFVDFLNARGNREAPENKFEWFDADNELAPIEGKGRNWTPVANLDEHPVYGVQYWGARAYCEWAGKRLPTEAEWEYAARGPDNLIYPWGNDFDGTSLNYCDSNCQSDFYADTTVDDGYVRTAPVGTYESGRSWVGAHDLIGNIHEWVADVYDEDYYNTSPTVNPQGPSGQYSYVIRGQSWAGSTELGMQAYKRYDSIPIGFAVQIVGGFRCARSY